MYQLCFQLLKHASYARHFFQFLKYKKGENVNISI